MQSFQESNNECEDPACSSYFFTVRSVAVILLSLVFSLLLLLLRVL